MLDFVSLYDTSWNIEKEKQINSRKVGTDSHKTLADFITHGEYLTMRDDSESYKERWVYHDIVSDKYSALVHERSQVYTQEHVQRFSGRYLETLDKFSIEGVIAWSEQSSLTIIRALCPDFYVSFLRRENIGEVYLVDGKLTKANYYAFVLRQREEKKKSDSRSVPQLWHPLKW